MPHITCKHADLSSSRQCCPLSCAPAGVFLCSVVVAFMVVKTDTEYYVAAAACAALINFPLWKATIVRQSRFEVPLNGRLSWGPFLDPYRPPYRGVTAALIGMTWARTVIFAGSDWGKAKLQKYGITGPLSSAIPALITSALVQIANNPIFKANVQIQNPRCPYRNVRESLAGIYRQEGFRGLMHGASAGVFKVTPKYGVAVVVKDYMEETLAPIGPNATRQDHVGRAAIKGLVAGLASAIVCNPFDVIRNEMYKQRAGTTIFSTVRQIIQTSGVIFVVRGLEHNIVSVTVPIGITIFLADFFQRLKDESRVAPAVPLTEHIVHTQTSAAQN